MILKLSINSVPQYKIIIRILFAIAAARLISLGLYPLFDPTEGRYAEIGRKMLETNNFITPFISYNVPFWAKPPLSFWLTAFSYKIFGINEFAARLPSYLLMGGIIWLVWLFKNCYCNQLRNEFSYNSKKNLESLACNQKSVISDSIITALILSSMGLFFYLAGGVMTDPALAFGITLAMVAFWRAVVWQQKLWGYCFFAGIIIALLAKGPIGVIIMGVPIFIWVLIHDKWRDLWRNLNWVYGVIIILMLVLPWYIMAEIRTPGFLHYFIIGEHFERFLVKGWKGDLYGGGRAHMLGTIWIYAMAAMLPWSFILLFVPFVKSLRQALFIPEAHNKSWQLYLWLWALTPLIFFTFAKNILITYTISSLPAFALLLTPVVKNFLQKKNGKLIVLAMACFVPIGFISALVAVNAMPDAGFIKSEEQIVRFYQSLAKDKNTPLLYYGKHSYSQDFYSGGKAIEIKEISDFEPYLQKQFFLIIPPAYYNNIPDNIKINLINLGIKNNSMLLAKVSINVK